MNGAACSRIVRALPRDGPIAYGRVHLVVGGILYNVVLLLAVPEFLALIRRRWTVVSVCIFSTHWCITSSGWGLARTRTSACLRSTFPVGVLILFLTYVTVALSLGLRLEPGRAWLHGLVEYARRI
jgi:hypothetical protein